MALQKVLYVFSCSDISHVLSSVGAMLETKTGGIVEITHYELSHNICPLNTLKFLQMPPSAFFNSLLEWETSTS